MRHQDEIEFRAAAGRLLADAAAATAASLNEENLRHAIETSLERECASLDIPWTPYQLDRTLRANDGGTPHFADVVHGALIIEYEPPKCFAAGRAASRVQHAQSQAIDYAERMSREEGRPIGELYPHCLGWGAHPVW
jgi:hypothetical protein